MDGEIGIQEGAMLSLARKSWVAYIPYVLLGLVAAMIAINGGTGLLIGLLLLAIAVYGFLETRSYHLYYDGVGIWVFNGILPWKKATRGVKWRDLDEANYYTNLLSWLFKSYSIRIGHRFTKSAEILLSNMTLGDKAVIAINEQHQNLIREGNLG
jgi:hypothetical protein